MRTIVLIDTNYGRGHHLMYMRWISKILLTGNARVISFFPVSAEVSTWIQEHCPEKAEHFYAFDLPNLERWNLPLIGRRNSRHFFGVEYLQKILLILGRWKQAADAVNTACQKLGCSPDLVFFNWIDNYFSYYLSHRWIDLIFPYAWSGLYFRPGDLRFQKQVKRQHYAIAQSSRCLGLTLLNEDTIAAVKQTLAAPVVLFPDFTDESAPNPHYALVQKIREQAGDRKIIGLLGSLSKRKGIMTLLEVARRSQSEDYFFVFVGTFKSHTFAQDYNESFPEEFQTVKDCVAYPPDNCFFYTDFIASEADFNALVKTCDVLFAAYENFKYSSNILAKAAVFEKPVIVSEGYCMAERVKTHRLGVVVPEADVRACQEALKNLFAASVPEDQQRFDFASYRRLHSTERLAEIFQALLEPVKSEVND
jgi:glycosyltransferase involved in cell wall biosynthesis